MKPRKDQEAKCNEKTEARIQNTEYRIQKKDDRRRKAAVTASAAVRFLASAFYLLNSSFFMNRLEREKKTIKAMIEIFCRDSHGTARKLLCPECRSLLDYAKEKLDRCPFGQNKGACSKCRIHCYKPDMRKQVTEVMRYAGPRMLRKHPLLAIDHLLKLKGIGRRKRPEWRTDDSARAS